jgi:hypothetical protein
MTVIEACKASFAAHQRDCSGFACAVAAALGVPLAGNANQIADTVRAGADGWEPLADGVAAAAAATDKLVIVGLRGDAQARPDAHGHVVVVVAGELNRGRYPTAFWGSLGGPSGDNQTINHAWTEQDRDKVAYAAHAIP